MAVRWSKDVDATLKDTQQTGRPDSSRFQRGSGLRGLPSAIKPIHFPSGEKNGKEVSAADVPPAGRLPPGPRGGVNNWRSSPSARPVNTRRVPSGESSGVGIVSLRASAPCGVQRASINYTRIGAADGVQG